jgi:hypothetical protein
MEKKDILYLIGAMVIVVILAVVIRPLFTQGTLAFSGSSPPSEDGETPTTNFPSLTPSPAPTSAIVQKSWNGEITVLRFLDEMPPTEMNDTAMQKNEPDTASPPVVRNSTVTAAYPVIPADKPSIPEEVIHPQPTMEYRGQINTSIIFEETYVLRYNSVGFLADVVKPPFVIAFTTVPTTTNSYYLNNPHYCFMTITVRDPETMEVLTEEGYNRVYSTDRSKVITLYRSGAYHVTVYGNMVQAKVTVMAGI